MNNWECLVAVSPLVLEDRAYPCTAYPCWYVLRCSQIVQLEGLFGAMNKNSEVVTGHTKIAAHLISTPLLKEQSLQQATIFFREFVENVPNLLLHLPLGDGFGGTNRWIGNGIDDSGVS